MGPLTGLLFAPVIEKVPMAIRGVLVVFAAADSLRVKNAVSVFRAGFEPAA